MRILWSIHLYPPHHNCGSEWMAHNINKYLISKGHQVRVILHQGTMNGIEMPYMYEGVEVMPPTGRIEAYEWADVICTHLDFTQYTIIMADMAKRPLIHFVHNDITYSSIENAYRNNYVVYNSEWVGERLQYKWPSIVHHPPCDSNYYNVCEDPEQNEFITLISLNENKGGKLFYQLAEAMPERKFLGVVGSYDKQVIRQDLPNVTIVPNTPDILSVYRMTRVLLMPSAYESWGRTATEAMCSGIPVVCTPTPGLKENCGEAAIYVNRRKKPIEIDGAYTHNDDGYDLKPIIRAIKKLDDKKYYKQKSEQCRTRAKELDPKKELEQLEQFIVQTKFN